MLDVVEPVSTVIAASVAALVARTRDRAATATVRAGEGVLRRLVGRVRARFSDVADEDAQRALALVEQVPDSARVTEYLATVIARHADDDPGFLADLEQLVGEARRAGIDVDAITQVAIGDDNVLNTVYLNHAIEQLRADGYPVIDADVARLSPYMRRHINFHGHYSFAATDLGGARRALRDPEAPTRTDEASTTSAGRSPTTRER